LHLVDLDGAKSSKIVNYKILEQIASQTSLKIDFGGGLKSDADLKLLLKVVPIKSPVEHCCENRAVFEWIATFGADKIILGADK
jgi:phosphoribosylformimino-5-aminoimidazole carboxamide ribotide isomerase